jgi:triphosphatase
MPSEIELKLRLAASDIPRLRRHRLVRQHCIGRPVSRKLTSIYYDTPHLDLLKAGISLRVRRMSGGWFQSIKTAGKASDGLHDRQEWEDLLHRGAPDFAKITDPWLRTIFDDADLRAALRPIFTTAVKRTEWQLDTGRGHIEMALDIGHLMIEDQALADICEVELELKHGDEDQLFTFADQLQETIALHAENTSKAELGYAFYLKVGAGRSADESPVSVIQTTKRL